MTEFMHYSFKATQIGIILCVVGRVLLGMVDCHVVTRVF